MVEAVRVGEAVVLPKAHFAITTSLEEDQRARVLPHKAKTKDILAREES